MIVDRLDNVSKLVRTTMYNVIKIEILLPQSNNPKLFDETIAAVPAHEIRHIIL